MNAAEPSGGGAKMIYSRRWRFSGLTMSPDMQGGYFMDRFRASAAVVYIVAFVSFLRADDAGTGVPADIVRSLSSYTLGKTGLHMGGSLFFSTEADYVAGANGTGGVRLHGSGVLKRVEREKSPLLYTGIFSCAYGIFDFLDAGVDMPLYFDVTGWGEDIAGAGDLGLSLKMAHPFQKENAFFLHAYFLKITFPTGSADRGFFPRHSYYLMDSDGLYPYTADAVALIPAFVWTFDFERLSRGIPVQVNVNIGGAFTAQRQTNSAFLAAVGVVYTPFPVTSFFLEFAAESRVGKYGSATIASAFDDDPLWLSPGIRFNLPYGFYVSAAGDIGLSDNAASARTDWTRGGYDYSTKAIPRFGVQASLGWRGILKEDDTDGDGIIDKNDPCPEETEDMDGFKDIDGCPDPDNDGDGFSDDRDRCPDTAGTEDGCPVYDHDRDGVSDSVDKCPENSEDMDGFEDKDGCPDLDNDNDGVIDTKDDCPDKAEDNDGFGDSDGCPDPDNDEDGIPDVEDNCPGVRGLSENRGCPKTKEISRGKLILNGVTFQAGKAVLTSNSFTIIDQVCESLAEWPEVKLEIQGHTDNFGNAMANLRLSQQRADAVKAYMIRKNIAPDRLRAVGYGEEFPIADNHTAEGREKNRRVELRRID